MTNFFDDTTGIKVSYLDNLAHIKLGNFLSKFIDEKLLIMCVGTDKCIGDCVGPMVGTLLLKNNFKYPVIGTLDSPTHALNLNDSLKYVKKNYPEHFVIAIDACISHSEDVGDIQVRMGPVNPGKGVGKSLPKIGDISIVAAVDSIDGNDIFSMRSIRLSFIMKLSEIIKDALLYASNTKT